MALILTPVAYRHGPGMFVPVERYTPAHLDQMSVGGIDPAEHIQYRFGHRNNLHFARLQLGPDQLERALLERQQQDMLERLASTPQITVGEVERIRLALARADQRARDAERDFYDAVSRADEQERMAEAAADRARQAEQRAAALRAQIDQIKAAQAGRADIDPCVREAFAQRMAGAPLAPEQTLRLLAHMYPDRVEVLETAYVVAREARLFTRPEKVTERLLHLVLDYVDAMRAGKGDKAGIRIFGADGYAAKESETMEGRREAMRRRTFTYRGQDYYRHRHLKVGTGHSATEGWRCHFAWLPDEGRVIIGHCGKHLDLD